MITEEKTLRDEFAMAVLPQCLQMKFDCDEEWTEEEISKIAYDIADAMMKQREK